MGFSEHGQQTIDFIPEPTPLTEMAAVDTVSAPERTSSGSTTELSDGHYYARLILQEGPESYFCPRCGSIQHTAYACPNCTRNYPAEVIPLNADTFPNYAKLIRDNNPLRQ